MVDLRSYLKKGKVLTDLDDAEYVKVAIKGIRDNLGGGLRNVEHDDDDLLKSTNTYILRDRQNRRYGQLDANPRPRVYDNAGNSCEVSDIVFIERDKTVSLSTVLLLNEKRETLLTLTPKTVVGEDGKPKIVQVQEQRVPHMEAEIHSLLKELYPDIERKLCMPIRSEKEMVDMSLFDSNVPEGTWMPINDHILNDILSHINHKIYEAGYTKGNDVPKTKMIDILDGIMSKNRPDVIKDTIIEAEQELPTMTEQELRHGIGDVFRCTLGAYVDGFTDAENEEYVDRVATAWILGGIARMMSLVPIIHTTIPTIICTQQGVGKSDTVRWAAMDDTWYVSSTAKLDSDRGLEDFRYDLEGRLVVELPEAESYTRTSDNFFKAYISRGEDTFRSAYARKATTMKRRYILAMTSNHTDLLTDMTGNRRFYPLFVSIPSDRDWADVRKERMSFMTKENAVRIWAMGMRLYNMLMERDPTSTEWNIEAGWELAKTAQKICLRTSPDIEAIEDWIDTCPDTMKVGAEVTKRDVQEIVFESDGMRKASRDEKYAVERYLNSSPAWDIHKDKHKGRHGIRGYTAGVYYTRKIASPACTASPQTSNVKDDASLEQESRDAERRASRQRASQNAVQGTVQAVERTNAPSQASDTVQADNGRITHDNSIVRTIAHAVKYAMDNRIGEGDLFTMQLTNEERAILLKEGNLDTEGRWHL